MLEDRRRLQCGTEIRHKKYEITNRFRNCSGATLIKKWRPRKEAIITPWPLHCQNSHSLLRTLFKCTIMTSEHCKASFAFDIVHIQNNHLITKSDHRLKDQTVNHHHPKIYLVEQIALPRFICRFVYLHTHTVFKCNSVEFADPIHLFWRKLAVGRLQTFLTMISFIWIGCEEWTCVLPKL